MTLSFTVYGEPQGKGRPRFSRNGTYVRTYTPNNTMAYEQLVKLAYAAEYHSQRFTGGVPLALCVDAYLSICKSMSRKNRCAARDGTLRPTKKPDSDNILKIIADALNGVAYHDDAQIVETTVRKYYSEESRVEITLWDILPAESEK